MDSETLNQSLYSMDLDGKKEKKEQPCESSEGQKMERLKRHAYGKPSLSSEHDGKSTGDEDEARAENVVFPLVATSDARNTHELSVTEKPIKKSDSDREECDMSQLSQKYRKILSTVPKEKQAYVALQMTQKKKKSEYITYCTMIGNIVLNEWSPEFYSYVESLILNKAIAEGFIKEDHLKWIFVVEKERASGIKPVKSVDITIEDSELVQLIWIDFNMREHFSQVASHRYWVMQSFLRLSRFTPELPEEVIERHDLSKFAFSQAIGYTLKWVHGISNPMWGSGCKLHVHGEPHHPEMWSKRHTPEYKASCLESWLCVKTGGEKYGLQISKLDLSSDNMAKVFLLESLIDMVGIEWERKKGKRLDITDAELIAIEDRYLNRYTVTDKLIIKALMQNISDPIHL